MAYLLPGSIARSVDFELLHLLFARPLLADALAGLATVAARRAQVDCQTIPKVYWNSAEHGLILPR